MQEALSKTLVVYTNKAHCRDCYRCVRACPVDAIAIRDGQAYVVEERCVSCGACIRECPQKARTYRRDLEGAMALIQSGAFVAATVAPSFASVFPESRRRRFPAALRKLGFDFVGETAVGAGEVAREMARLAGAEPHQPHICTACPAVVAYVERYAPAAVDDLTPVASPMVVHGRMIKERFADRSPKVVFIGPCVAKKAEADRPESRDAIDCVLTFEEVMEWFERAGLDLDDCRPEGFDDVPAGAARYFPLAGGSLRTASLSDGLLDTDVASVAGVEELREILDDVRDARRPIVIEPLFCHFGCVNGPAMPEKGALYKKRRDLIAYAAEPEEDSGERLYTNILNSRILENRYQPAPMRSDVQVSEDDVIQALESMGKRLPDDQLNCGACGYNTCRDKAVAVVRGLAEREMCIPFMRRLAEQRTDRIIETSPNGIVILDERLDILHMNPAFTQFFQCGPHLAGRPISYLMDPALFEQLATGQVDRVDTVVRHETYGMICRQILYPLRDEKQYVGIFINITHLRTSKEKLDRLRSQTLNQARELLDHQMQVAQSLVQAMAESTAQGEELVEKLMVLAEEDGDVAPGAKGRDWIWATSTSK